MRTKTLLLSALACAAGVSAASAQVYSVNAVGYVNVEIPGPGFHLISNPLLTEANTLNDLFPDVAGAVYTRAFKFNPETQSYTVSDFIPSFGWTDNFTLDPGEGAFISTSGAGTVTFVGEVAQGDLSVEIQPGFNIISSAVPQTVDLNDANFAFPAATGDRSFVFDGAQQAYAPADFIEGFGFAPVENVAGIEPGSAFFYFNGGASATSWDRNFNVNN